ncbi:nickel insertion protein [Tepidibacillus sp. HK-1]|uniref:nickel insertion protein n=1 Tax=Tepidibacillus sp. HK-1 TaxID=1883407 RepID=UPI002107F9F0|nr:nickel insertion protein [Tepidibacillus sp. HK-1]
MYLENLVREIMKNMKNNLNEHIDKQMVKIEVSLDDMNPEFYGYIMEQLFSMGVNDVYIVQVIMKKNRPGQVLHILCREEIREKVMDFLFLETTTLGIRYTPYTVHRLERTFIEVETEWGKCTVKIGKREGKIVQIAPEYEECVRLAKEHQVPIKWVYDLVKEKGYQWAKEQ